MSKHTPGPWALSSDGAEIWPTTGDTAAVELCRVVGPWDSSSFYGEKTALANARLIAAAPDLLAAIREAEICLTSHQDGDEDDFGTPEFSDRCEAAILAARAAIAKATGCES